MIRITVDIGGTFTDVVGFDEETGQLLLGKSMSTPQNLVTGIFDAIAGSGSSLPETSLLIHGRRHQRGAGAQGRPYRVDHH